MLIIFIVSHKTKKSKYESTKYCLNELQQKVKSLAFNDVENYEKKVLKFVLDENPTNKHEIARMSSFSNKNDISSAKNLITDGNVKVGKLYRYLENKYYQNYPDAESFANYKFDIDNKANDNVQEQLRSIVQAYLYLKNK